MYDLRGCRETSCTSKLHADTSATAWVSVPAAWLPTRAKCTKLLTSVFGISTSITIPSFVVEQGPNSQQAVSGVRLRAACEACRGSENQA